MVTLVTMKSANIPSRRNHLGIERGCESIASPLRPAVSTSWRERWVSSWQSFAPPIACNT